MRDAGRRESIWSVCIFHEYRVQVVQGDLSECWRPSCRGASHFFWSGGCVTGGSSPAGFGAGRFGDGIDGDQLPDGPPSAPDG